MWEGWHAKDGTSNTKCEQHVHTMIFHKCLPTRCAHDFSFFEHATKNVLTYNGAIFKGLVGP